VPLLLGGVLLVVFALLSLSASEGEEGRKKAWNTVMGALLVAALVFVLIRSGLSWVAVVLVVLYSAGQRFRAQRRTEPAGAGQPEPSVARGMSSEEAHAILGVAEGASRDTILDAYKRLMKKMHPDQGGSTYLAARINQAKDMLVDK
jgi:hypothetical protein